VIASRFVARYLRESGIASDHIQSKVRARLEELFRAGNADPGDRSSLADLKERLENVDAELAVTKRNLALAKTEAVFDAVSETFAALTSQRKTLVQKLLAESARNTTKDIESEVVRATKILDKLPALVEPH
jgi:hypothetical protein